MQPTAWSLARTYSDRVYPDPWEKVLDYRRVQEYIAKHPNAGRVRVGNALELPPSRVRAWINDGMPDPVRGINVAIDHGWLDPEPDSETASGLVRLAAHVIGGGGIGENWMPALSVGRRMSAVELETAFDDLGIASIRRHEDVDGRATEVVPRDGGTVLGRCLVTMGLPKGSKQGLDRLPGVLDVVPAASRREFVTIFLQHRALNYEGKATTRVQGERSASYFRELAALIESVSGESANVGDGGVTIPADTARELGLG